MIATLNPSLTEALFKVIQQYFVDKGILVIMTTHSIDTLMLAPAYAKLYQIYKPNSVGLNRIEPLRLESDKDSDAYDEYKKIRQKFFSTWDVEKSSLLKIKKELNNLNQPLIITEGKTDWKYLIKALEYFHKKNEFRNIEARLFYQFETDDMGDTKLRELLQSFISTSNFNNPLINHPIIGIFDSDNPEIKVLGLNSGRVSAIQISDTKKISTEFLFSNNETELKKEIGGRRLYTSDEFSSKTLKLKAQNEINTTKINSGRLKKLEKDNLQVVIDDQVYGGEENIALTKDEFAQAILDGEIQISERSWENFRPIMIKINSILTSAVCPVKSVAEICRDAA